MKTSSAKAKGRRLQQKVAKCLQEFFNLAPSEVRSLPMGAQGADIWLSAAAKAQFPFAIECKNVEKINVWQAWEQAKTNTEIDTKPMVVFSRNNEDVLVILKFSHLLEFKSK